MRKEDLFHSMTESYRRRIEEARELISRALEVSKKPAVAVSTGKDSTALLGLVLEQTRDVIPVFYDSGMEYPETYEMIEKLEKHFGIEFLILEPELDMKGIIELENAGMMTPALSKRLLIIEPSRWLVETEGVDLIFVGLRKEESKGRRIALSKLKDGMRFSRETGCYLSYPLMNLTAQDVFAYIAENNIPLHPIYEDPRILEPREKRRVGSFAGATAAEFGRWYWLKQTHPELFRKLFELDPAAGWYV